MNKNIINIRHESRAILMSYLDAKEAKKTADAAEKAAKAAAKEVLLELGKTYKNQGSTDYIVGIVQKMGKAMGILYKETTKRGAIDWESYAKSLGGTDEGAEMFRKANTISVSIDYATDKQNMELGL